MAQKLQTGVDTGAIFNPTVPAPASPFGSFAPDPYGKPDPLASASQQGIAERANLTAQQNATGGLDVPAPANPNAALAGTVAKIAGSAAGFGAGSQQIATPDATDAALQVGGSVLSGAGAGFIASGGNPVGAVVGGVVGLVSGGINAYLGTRRARAQNRQIERRNAEIRRMQKEEQDYQRMLDGRNRGDQLEQTRYNRSIASIQSQWTAHNAALSRVNELLKTNTDFREQFIRGQR